MKNNKFRAWDGSKYHYYTSLRGLYGVLNPIEEQCTGLKDKNRVEIYEGDIIADESKERNNNTYVCEYVKEEAIFVFCSPNDGEVLDDNRLTCNMVVIGNIQENPKLLK